MRAGRIVSRPSGSDRRMLGPGDRIPDLPLLRPDGGRRSLRAFEGEATALIFLRHLG